jgi:hypothetical protein
MNPEQWARVKDVFNAALEHEAGARRAFVAEATAGDDSVRAEVERLLDALRESADFIERPAAGTLLSGRVISHYEIGRLLGSGGMGTCMPRATQSSAERWRLRWRRSTATTHSLGCAGKRSTRRG